MAQATWPDAVLIARVAEFWHPAAETGRFAARSRANDGSSGVSILASSGPAPGRWPRPGRFNLCVFSPWSRSCDHGLCLPHAHRAAVTSRQLHGLRRSLHCGGGMPELLFFLSDVIDSFLLFSFCC